jgi:hypothetical protein
MTPKCCLRIALPVGSNRGIEKHAFMQAIEGEHFDSRAKATDNDHQFKIVPSELTADELASPDGQYQHARGGSYMVSLPDAAGGGENRNSTDLRAAGPHLDFKVQINTTGEYQLYAGNSGKTAAALLRSSCSAATCLSR